MRTTISLPDGLGQLARSEARRRGVSVSAIIREAMEAHLRKPATHRLPWQGMVSDPHTNARMLDEVLASGWGEVAARGRR
ncbi:MAG: ribbon-helix-helix domain-containing protein [Gammaproteobacteria bacterium]|nr:ribbon-helix-helix domain-containing protein [Gammaproteobacteria bacterium]